MPRRLRLKALYKQENFETGSNFGVYSSHQTLVIPHPQSNIRVCEGDPMETAKIWTHLDHGLRGHGTPGGGVQVVPQPLRSGINLQRLSYSRTLVLDTATAWRNSPRNSYTDLL